MKVKNIFILFLLGCIASAHAGVKITENTTQRFSFEWTTEGVSVASSGTMTKLSFKDENVTVGENNEPLIPGYSFYVGVPRSGSPTVTFTPLATHSILVNNELQQCVSPKKRYPALSFSSVWFSNPQPSRFSDLNALQFFIRPFTYDKESKSLTVLDRGVFTIEFPSAPTVTVSQNAVKSDYNRMLTGLILNYSVASQWGVWQGLAKRAKIKELPPTSDALKVSFKIGDGHGGLNEGTINENGIVKISGSDLLRIFGTSQTVNSIALYVSYKGELPLQTPGFSEIPSGMTEVPLLRFDKGTIGKLDSLDYVLAYVSGASDWLFDTTKKQYNYIVNHFDDYRTYWLGISANGKAASLTPVKQNNMVVSDTLVSTDAHLFLKRSQYISFAEREGGSEWLWVYLTAYLTSFSYKYSLPNIDVAMPCSVKVDFRNQAGVALMEILDGNTSVCTGCDASKWNSITPEVGEKTIGISINPTLDDTVELKSFEFKYSQKLDMSDKDSLTIFSPVNPGNVRYRLSGLSKDLVYVFRITNNENSIMLVDTIRGPLSYEWSDTAGIGIRYYVCTQKGMKTLPTVSNNTSGDPAAPFQLKSLRTLRDILSQGPIDYLVVTHPNFMTQAQRLCQHKKAISRFTNPIAVSTTDIYNQFSGGNTDPAAIRNALAYIREYQRQQWPQSSVQMEYVVFMGAGHYDQREIMDKSGTSFIPVAELRGICVEDFFVSLDSGSVVVADGAHITENLFFGRIPCRTEAEANQVVEKIKLMEDPKRLYMGNWKNRILLVADDDMQGTKVDGLGRSHMESSEQIDAIVTNVTPYIDIRKVYLFDYPWNGEYEKPEATQALINNINNGVSLVNYFGHGAPNVWADERLFRPENIGNLINEGRYPLISSFSCSVGKFDQPGDVRSLSEDLVLADKKGAIATIAATRAAYAGQNENLAKNFFNNVLDTVDSTATPAFGAAFAKAKRTISDENQKTYSFLGDPSICIARSVRKITITQSAEKNTAIDTLKALQRITIRGTIGNTKKESTADPLFGAPGGQQAFVQISMFNPPYDGSRKDNGTVQNFTYKEPGTPIFSGQTLVKGGIFEQQVLIPKNISFDKFGAKILAFAWNGQDVAYGVKNNILFHGYDQTTISDTTGPHISVRPIYKTILAQNAESNVIAATQGVSSTDKISARLPFTLELAIADSSGIDAVSTSPDEGLTYEITGVKNQPRTNINQQFQFLQGDYRRGSATIGFESALWNPGLYKLTVSSEDLLGNITHKTFDLEIVGEQDLGLYHVFNYPNPMRMGESSRFYFDLSTSTVQLAEQNVRVIIKIYTLSGRLLRVITNARRGELFDGKDNFGNKLSPGVYLYQILASSQQKLVKSKIEKLAINPPR